MNAGVGMIILLMLPHTLVVLIARIIFVIIWRVLGIPLGPGRPVAVP